MNLIRDRAPPPFKKTLKNPGGWWSEGGTGGGMMGQVHEEVPRPGTKAKLAE